MAKASSHLDHRTSPGERRQVPGGRHRRLGSQDSRCQTGEWIAGGLALGTDSGNLSNLYSSNASLSAIVTPPDSPGGTP